MFAAAVSLVTGKVLYVSDQVASIFHCKRGAFYDAKFVEFLAPHDVSVFHSATTPYKLPPWSVCSGGEGPAVAAQGRGDTWALRGKGRLDPLMSARASPKGPWPPSSSKAKEKKLFRINLEAKSSFHKLQGKKTTRSF